MIVGEAGAKTGKTFEAIIGPLGLDGVVTLEGKRLFSAWGFDVQCRVGELTKLTLYVHPLHGSDRGPGISLRCDSVLLQEPLAPRIAARAAEIAAAKQRRP